MRRFVAHVTYAIPIAFVACRWWLFLATTSCPAIVILRRAELKELDFGSSRALGMGAMKSSHYVQMPETLARCVAIEAN